MTETLQQKGLRSIHDVDDSFINKCLQGDVVSWNNLERLIDLYIFPKVKQLTGNVEDARDVMQSSYNKLYK